MRGIRRHRRTRLDAAVRRRLLLETLETRRLLASLVVTTHRDVVEPGDGLTSLREAIDQSNSLQGADTISFDPVAFADPTQIDLALGQLRATDPVEIIGPGKGQLTIDAGGDSRVIEFFSYDGDLVLRQMTLAGGQTTGSDVNTSQSGGGIRFVSAGTLTLDSVDVLDNQTRGDGAKGGGIFADPGNVSIHRSSIAGNRTHGDDGRGGAIFVRAGSLTVVDSILSGNATAGVGARGGGIYSSGSSVTVVRSSISENATERDQADGGGIWTSADLTIDASLVIRNRTVGTDSDGGAIFSTGSVTLTGSDLSLNSTGGIGAGGGGMAVDSANVTIDRSSITGNQTASQFSYGGGLFVIRSDITVRGSTISTNRALGADSDGGGLAIFFGSAEINGSTIFGNETVGQGGGILMVDNANRSFQLENSIVAGNSDTGVAPDFLAPNNPTSLTVLSTLIGDNAGTTLDESQDPDFDGNLIGDRTGGGVIDPELGSLRLAGTTRVHPLVSASPAINAGDNGLSLGRLTDQRGNPFVRIFAGQIDMGAFESQVVAASRFEVDTLVDELNFGNSATSLREAIVVANGNPGPDAITFDPSILDAAARIDLNDHLRVTDAIAISAPTEAPVTLAAVGPTRVIDVDDEAGDLTLSGLVLRGGRTVGPEGGGAGIRFASPGNLVLTDSEIRDNQTAGNFAGGGGIHASQGSVTLTRSVVADNATLGDFSGGGGIRASRLVVIDSSVTNNQTTGLQSPGGGAVVLDQAGVALQLRHSTVSGNRTGGAGSHGGGVAVMAGGSSIDSSTLSGNSAGGSGGGVYWSANVEMGHLHQLLASTIADNHSDGPGGGLSAGVHPSGIATVSSSLIALNTSDTSNPDLDFGQTSGSLALLGNLIGDNAGTSLTEAPGGDTNGNLVGSSLGAGALDPLLAELASRGGTTASHGLLSGSPAIDAGRSSLVASLTTDQRGDPFVRVFGSAPDIGSFETQRLDQRFLTVNTADDEFDSDSTTISLREAIEFSSASDGIDTIKFDPIVFATPQTIRLSSGQLRIRDSVHIDGPGDDLLTIDAQSNHRVFDMVGALLDISLVGATVTGGVASDGPGGGIRFVSNGELTLADVTLVSNRTSDRDAGGGGLSVDGGTVSIAHSIINNNETSGDGAGGGGVLVQSGNAILVATVIQENRTSGDDAEGGGINVVQSDLRLQGVLVSSNRTTGDNSGGAGIATEAGALVMVDSHVDQNQTFGDSVGGGLKSEQTAVEVISSAITRNRTNRPTASGGGAALESGSFDLVNSTLSSNVAAGANASGGGMIASNVLTRVINSTITSNSAGLAGGGIAVVALGSLQLDNSVVAANPGPSNSPDLFVSLSNPANLAARFSLIGDRAGTLLAESQQPDASGNRIGSSTGGGVIDPILGPLADNGGRTPTHLPLTGSPVIDAGDDVLALDPNGAALRFDNRGEPLERIFDTVDQGAVENQPPREPLIVWDRPANIFVGTALGTNQLNASTSTSGTFTYSPPTGTVLPLGDDQTLSVRFVPDNTTVFAPSIASVLISVVEIADRGDAPDSYATRHASDGPRHAVGSLHLGVSVDAEPEGAASLDASGDGSDEDGVTFVTTLVTDPTRLTLATVMVEASERGGKLDAWIDFDLNGRFDHATEHLSGGQSVSLASGENRISFAIPAGASAGNTFARFRISSEGGLLPTGSAPDGEVEDYAVTLVDGTTVPIVSIGLPLGRSTLRLQGDEVVVGRDTRDFFRAPFASVARFEFAGNRTSNVLTVDSSSGVPIPAGGFSFDGDQGVNTVRLVGSGLSLDLSSQGNVSLANVDVIDTIDVTESTIRVDSAAARAMDPAGNGVIIVGSPNDQFEIADGAQWRMATPSGVAGLFFSVVRLRETFIQVDFTSKWQNLAQASDINNDGDVTAADALRIINELSRRAFSDPITAELADPAAVAVWPNSYYDQNGDGRATALDALRVINDLARRNTASGEWITTTPSFEFEFEFEFEFDEDEDEWVEGQLN